MNKIKKVINIIQWLLIILLLFTAGSLVLSNFDNPLNLRVFSVNSGSMEPAISVGSIVFVRPQENYNEQDVITYQGRNNSQNTTTHRIVGISRDEDIGTTNYRTKGDANEDPDPTTVREDRVLGKVILNIPLLGYLVAFSKTQAGFIVLVVVPATLIIYSEINNIKNELAAIFSNRKEQSEDET